MKRLLNILPVAKAFGKKLAYDLNSGRRDERHCRFVGSHGLMKSCALKFESSGTMRPMANSIEQQDAKIRSIYVETDDLSVFAETSLPDIDFPFILVSGNSDTAVKGQSVGQSWLDEILSHSQLDTWLAQNCDLDHPKLKPLPIGLDYHTLASRVRHRVWGVFSEPTEQEQTLLAVRSGAPPLEHKRLAGYCNWHHTPERGDRQECLDNVSSDVLHKDQMQINRSNSWRNNAGFLFTLSPFGNGIDCHRTWEALILGSVPIVRRSGICELFEGLPVCIVDEWAEVDAYYLKSRRDWVLQTDFDFSGLKLLSWSHQFHGEQEHKSTPKGYQSFLAS